MLLRYKQIPKINKDANVEELLEVFSTLNIKDAFEFNIQDGLLAVRSLKNELAEMNITFPKSMLCQNTNFPTFVFCNTVAIKNEEHVLTHWELMYLLLASRLPILAEHKYVFGGLIQQDISSVNSYVIYSEGNSYNTKVKNRNTVVLLDPYDHMHPYSTEYKRKGALGDWLFKSPPTEYTIRRQLDSMNCVPGSETMLSQSQKVIIDNSEDEYKAPAFEVLRQGDKTLGFKTLFPPKQNVPSRLKTHLHGEAYDYSSPDDAIYLQDVIYNEDGTWVTKDKTFRNMVVLFDEIDPESYRFAAGEIEVSESFGSEIVKMNKHRELQLDELFLEEGKTYSSVNGRIKIGMYEEEMRSIDNVDKIDVLKIDQTGLENSYRIEYVSYHKASNARIVSHTGLKGVTKVMKNLGYVQYGSKEIPVDLTCSMNSLKGKMNTIILAQAALAFKLGCYIPKNGELLDSLDEEEINAAAQSLPEFQYIKNGEVTNNVKVGLIQVQVTELGSTYARIKMQTFSFNALKYLDQQNCKLLAEHIRANNINEEKKQIALELNRVITDQYGYLIETNSNMPIYRLDELKDVFGMEDMILSKRNIIHYNSKLLDEEYNEGFYIHCKPIADEYIRIPSAKILNAFWDKLEASGEYIYQDILINISKIITACIEDPAQPRYQYVTHPPRELNKTRMTAKMAYLKCCKNMLFSGEVMGQQIIKTFLAPEIPGISLKQITDKHVPSDVIVILDDKIYQKLHNIAYERNPEYALNSFKAFGLRNPHLWRSQTTAFKVWNKEMLDEHMQDNYGISLYDYLSVDMNRFCVLVSKHLISCHHSDCDGDLLSISVPQGIEAQALLNDFELEGTSEDELKWNKEYLDKESSSNEDFNWNAKYKLYTIYNTKHLSKSNDNYNNFLCNAAVAKSAVGE